MYLPEIKNHAVKVLLFLFVFLSLAFTYYISAISFVHAQVPVPPPYVPCGSTRNPEFHSLRPYQASPCDQGVSEIALFCGNSLILSDRVSRTQTIAPNVASNCKPLGNSKYKCSFTFNKTTNIAIDLSEAELPIAGYTEEKVVSSQNQPDPEELTDADKVNEYVSWYLNGTINRAEYPYLDAKDLEDVAKIVNFSGPLKKLLPRTIQMRARIATIKKARDERHNQIVGCTYGIRIPLFGKVIGGIPADCYDDSFLSFPRVEHRLSEWKNRLPPLEEDIGTKYKNFQEYWKAYQEWRGKFCFLIPIFGKEFLLCGQNPLKPDYIGSLFSYIPFSSTEDRKGQVSLNSSNVTPASPDIELTNVSLNVEPAELFFSHIEESVELAALLQQTFIPSGVEETGPVLNVSPSEFCDLTNIRANPGDDLFAGEIAGVLSYTADFSCEMNAGDIGKVCDKDVSIILNIQTETPQVDELWSRLVAGPAAVFKRIFPKIGVGSAIEGLLDMPAVTNVNYSADNLVSIGNPSAQRSGAELYFPHLGGIHEYFLKGIQTALRPKGFGEQIISGSAGTIPSSGDINCNQNAPEVNVSRLLGENEMYQLALNWVAGQPGNHVLECYNDVVAKSKAAGINIALTFWVWLHESNTSNYNISGLDFGVISAPSQDFVAQISAFLSTAQGYGSTPASCPPGTTPLQAFAYVYSSGQCDPNAPVAGTNQTAQGFYNELVSQLAWITSCPLPKSPTDNSCP